MQAVRHGLHRGLHAKHIALSGTKNTRGALALLHMKHVDRCAALLENGWTALSRAASGAEA
jgi:hypothetical protein